MQLTTGQRRFEHIARIHRPFGLTGSDHGVQLVDKENDLTLLFRQIVEHRFEPLLKVATVLGTGQQRTQI